MERWYLLVMGFWLLLCSIQDLKRKEIHIVLILAGVVIGIILSLFYVDITIQGRVLGFLLGVLLLGLFLLTKGQIGIADGIIMGIIGTTLGFYNGSSILLTALFVSAVLSLILIVFRKVKRKTTIPFIPFLFIGYVGVLLFT
ncbi:MAG: prepilin peptidase [Anaerocolumna sp.]